MLSPTDRRRTQSAAFFVVAAVASFVPPAAPLPLAPDFLAAFVFTGRMLAATCVGAGIGSLFGYGWCGAAAAIAPILVVLLVLSAF
jgi:hypothetical protein